VPDSFDKIILKDGRVGIIAEALELGVAYEFDHPTRGDGIALGIMTIYQDGVADVLEPFLEAEC